MNRRDLIAAVAATAAFAPGATARASAKGDAKKLREVARDAWLYGLPLIEMAGARSRALSGGRPANRLQHGRDLTTAKTQRVTTPNNDTLYSQAWIDLSEGPVKLELPATGERYFSVALMDMFSNNFAVLGTRTPGWQGGTFYVCGPGFSTGEPGTLRSPTPWVWMLVRTLVNGPADLPAARAVQDQIKLDGPAGRTPPAYAKRDAPWRGYFAAVQDLIVETPPRKADSELFKRAQLLGLRPGGGFDPSLISDAEAVDIEAGVAEARAAVASTRGQGPLVEGWLYPKANLGDFGLDYLYRAQTAVGGLAALPPQEATYLRAVDGAGGQTFDSAQDWRLLFRGGGLPPVKAFWSLTLYEATSDGQFFFVDNPLGRYAIGDRTPGLARGMDGSLEILISRKNPGGEKTANWLPAPPSKPFALVLRAYLPEEQMMVGAWRMPPLVQANAAQSRYFDRP